MSHEISIQNGAAEVFCGRGMAPWHGLGKVVQGLATAREALALANLDWRVKGYPISVNGKVLPFPRDGQRGDTWQALCRQDNGDFFGITRGQYTPIQNVEAFDFFDRLIGQGKAVYDTAGALRGGRQVWLLAKVDGEIQINGDEHRQYGLMLTSHDGSYALQVQWVMERVVCANTLSIALAGAQNTCKIRHLSSWKDKEGEAARVLGLGEHYFRSIQDALRGLTDKLLSPEEMEEFTRLLVPSPSIEESTRMQNIRKEIQTLFGAGDGNKGASRWDALQAVSDYADHSMTTRGKSSTRLESALQGAGARLKQRAYDMLTSDDLMAHLMDKPVVPSGTAASDLANPFNALLER